jgi:hypothetical protein
MSTVRDLADYMDSINPRPSSAWGDLIKRPLHEYWYCGVYLSNMSEEYASNIMQTCHTYGA